jgi:acyl carrier protein
MSDPMLLTTQAAHARAIERRVLRDLLPGIVPDALAGASAADEADLLGLLDSLQLLRLVVAVESAFDVKIDNSEITVENVGTPARLAAFIAAKTSRASS